MSSFFKKFVTILLALCLGFSIVACDKPTDDPEDPVVYYDNEEDPIRFSTLEVDRVFNPFFSTSATDGNVVGFTQLGMLSNDAEGNPVYGDGEACLVKDVLIDTQGKAPEPNQVDERLTTYYLVLKNNVKFSDGKPVTIKDVLFNLYVYLDMAYTGSSTIYSTDIVGLKEYRTQAATETEQDNFMKQFRIAANARVTALSESVAQILRDHSSEQYDSAKIGEWLREYENKGEAYRNLVADYEKTLELFRKELEDDWSNSLNSYEDTKFSDQDGNVYEGLFTTDVESFLYNEGIITWSKKDRKLYYEFGGPEAEGQPALCKSWTKDVAIQAVFDFNIPDKLDQVIDYWMTGSNLADYITNIELEKASATMEKKYPNISGIKFANGGTSVGGANSVTVNDVEYAKPEYNSDGSVKDGFNEVLSIQIHGVDPKAIWNFAFIVAPLHYYSGTFNGVNYVNEFSIENNNFGVAWNSQTFMDEVLNAPNKMGVPVGAGPYMAAKQSGGTSNVTPNDFYSNGIIYFERNPYYLLGPAKIKKLRLVVTSSTGMLNSLYTNQVDFAEPNAKPETTQEIAKKKNMASKEVETAGYGYIGINAGKIPDLEVRQAIMYCIDIMYCVDYYKSQAEPIYRAMSLSSWAYPKGATSYYPFIGGKVPANLDKVDPQYKEFVQSKGKSAGDTLSAAEQKEFIQGLMRKAGYNINSNGVYAKGSNVCKYTFTIAGEGTDHPAWIALFNAGKLLDSFGFNVTVKNDAQALKKLTSGSLTVWAAAWGSTIDPDMYQVYHKDSTATSVLNWGYPQIIRNAGNKYDREVALLDELSRLIDRGRMYEDHETRASIYSEALDTVMKLAVELPTYQRNDLFAYNESKIDVNTFNKDLSSYKGLTSDIHTVSLVTQ
ncbi:MAG: hypothetical protein J1F39_05255 [Clostridiales bacterium]|nr:hypothetical protein [Clostridiales bacterium]